VEHHEQGSLWQSSYNLILFYLHRGQLDYER